MGRRPPAYKLSQRMLRRLEPGGSCGGSWLFALLRSDARNSGERLREQAAKSRDFRCSAACCVLVQSASRGF
jgi:hypothetical protein